MDSAGVLGSSGKCRGLGVLLSVRTKVQGWEAVHLCVWMGQAVLAQRGGPKAKVLWASGGSLGQGGPLEAGTTGPP